jgi:F1F0 ATPase subunit 2
MIMTLCLAAGIVLGIFFFGGLWMTVQRLPSARHPATLALGSMVIRMATVLAGFLLLSRGRWQNTLAILLGMMTARLAVTRFTRCT